MDNLTPPSINEKLELPEKKFTKCINSQLGGLGERRELPLQGPGWSPGHYRISACFKPQNASGRKKNTILLPLVRVLENQIQALSRNFRHRFKDFQGPCLFSRTFQALKIWNNYFRTFKDFQGPARALLQTAMKFWDWAHINTIGPIAMDGTRARRRRRCHCRHNDIS